MRNTLLSLLLVVCTSIIVGIGVPTEALAQDQTEVTVPTVTGLTVPQAAAVLNQAGLKLGKQMNAEWSEAFGTPPNVIGLQSLSEGENVAYGTAVDITLLREPNVTLIYDDNDLTMLNRSGSRIDLSELEFNTLVSTNNARFRARRWGNELRDGRCTQLWAVNRSGSKNVPGCDAIQNWLTSNNPNDHFWTATNGVQSFSVIYEEQEYGICDAAPRNSQDNPLSCIFYLPARGSNDIAPFVQLAYTPDILVLMNPTDDTWMRPNKTFIVNANPNRGVFGDRFALGDPDLFGNPEVLGDIKRLAPGQCVVWVNNDAPGTALPQECTSLAQMGVPADQRFWTYDFEIESRDEKRRKCNAAQLGKLTLCLMPR